MQDYAPYIHLDGPEHDPKEGRSRSGSRKQLATMNCRIPAKLQKQLGKRERPEDEGDDEEDKELSKAEIKEFMAKYKEMQSTVAKLAKV